MAKGIFNTYRDGMPFSEVVLKDLRHVFQGLKNRMRYRGKLNHIVAYPDFPSKKTTLHKIANSLGYSLTNKAREGAELYIYWEDTTHGKLPSFLEGKQALNAVVTDISKEKVDAVHQEVFGYCTKIDPLQYQGKAVAKSDVNAKHDGRIIDCPIAKEDVEEGKIYQLLIDNQHDDAFVVDMRVPYIDGLLNFAYLKYRKLEVRFTNQSHKVEMVDLASLLSEAEQAQVARFCQAMELNFGELDVLRNKADGKIYVVDVNKTPYGPPAGISKEEGAKAVACLTEAVQKRLL